MFEKEKKIMKIIAKTVKGVPESKKDKLLDEMQGRSLIKAEKKERASQILGAVEGLRIWEARELLEHCIGALQRLDVSYRESREDTAERIFKMNAAPAPEAQERQGADKASDASDRESLIFQYESRLEKLKAGASPANVIL